jgi:transcriptional regulator of acetoin/glycerol metabolism
MTRLVQDAAALVSARATWVQTGSLPAEVTLRPSIAASWRRSLDSGVNPNAFQLCHAPTVTADGPLREAAAPVVDTRTRRLGGIAASLVVADEAGRVVHCSPATRETVRNLRTAHVEVGASFDEAIVGTNGVGTVLATEQAVVINGAEHYLDELKELACVGVPIRHPLEQRLVGVLNLCCRIDDADDRLLPFAREAAREIERRLYLMGSKAERLVLERFLSAKARCDGRPIISLNQDMIISNMAAAPLLDDIGPARIWQHASDAIDARRSRAGTLELTSGRTLATRCHPIGEGEEVVGALVELDAPASTGTSTTAAELKPGRNGGAAPAWALDGLSGTSPAWRAVATQVRSYGDSRLPLLIEGEAGVGKLALARSMFADIDAQGLLSVFEARLQPIEGAATWITTLRDALVDPQRVVVVRHVEALEDDAAQALVSLIETFEPLGTLFAGTLTSDRHSRAAHPRWVDRFAVMTVRIPPLRERRDDLEPLLEALTLRHADDDVSCAPPPRWLAQTVAALAQQEWPGNVRELESLVRRVLATTAGGSEITLAQLPQELRERNEPGRELTYLERLERDALVAALGSARGNKAEAAAQLGISRATLYRKIRAFGLEAERALA